VQHDLSTTSCATPSRPAMLPQLRKPYVLVATFFWVMVIGYLGWCRGCTTACPAATRTFPTFIQRQDRSSGLGDRLYDLGLQTQVQNHFSEGSALNIRRYPICGLHSRRSFFGRSATCPFLDLYNLGPISIALVGATAAYLRSRIPGLATIPWWLYYPAYFSFYPMVYGSLAKTRL